MSQYDQAISKYLEAKKIYDQHLPSTHPSQALLKVNFGNIYLLTGNYEKALQEFESSLRMQELTLRSDHPDIARTLHNLAVVCTHLGQIEQAKQYLERAEETAAHTLSAKHPVMHLLTKTKGYMAEESEAYLYTRLQ